MKRAGMTPQFVYGVGEVYPILFSTEFDPFVEQMVSNYSVNFLLRYTENSLKPEDFSFSQVSLKALKYYMVICLFKSMGTIRSFLMTGDTISS